MGPAGRSSAVDLDNEGTKPAMATELKVGDKAPEFSLPALVDDPLGEVTKKGDSREALREAEQAATAEQPRDDAPVEGSNTPDSIPPDLDEVPTRPREPAPPSETPVAAPQHASPPSEAPVAAPQHASPPGEAPVLAPRNVVAARKAPKPRGARSCHSSGGTSASSGAIAC